MRYKVGDKVRVRKDLEVSKNYGGFWVTQCMSPLRGKLVTIKSIGSNNNYQIKEYTEAFWTDEMFEPVITNWDKVKEEMKLDNKRYIRNWLCEAIHQVKNEKYCDGRTCEECKEWLKQPYKEPSILDEAEKKYLSAVIRPWRDKVKWITKECGYDDGEFITIRIKDEDTDLMFPGFKGNTMYKGMEQYKVYTLDELEI